LATHAIGGGIIAQGVPEAERRSGIQRKLLRHKPLDTGAGRLSLPHIIDRLMHLPEYNGLQRQNILGSAFAGLVKHVLEVLGNAVLSYELEVSGDQAFPGVQLPTRTGEPFIDILVRKAGRNIGIISTKWSIRHDRINDLTSECRAYKNAGTWTDNRIFYYVTTNEFDPARTEKLIKDKCIDRVVHVHKPLVTDVCGLDGRLSELLDLSDLIRQSMTW